MTKDKNCETMPPWGRPPSYLHATSTAFLIRLFRILSSNNAVLNMTAVIWMCYAVLYARCSTVFAASIHTLPRRHSFIKRISSASVPTSQRTKISLDPYSHHDNPSVASLPRDITDNNGNPSVNRSLTPSNSDSRNSIA